MTDEQYGIVPPGMRTGCLPRKWKCGERFPLLSTKIKIIPREQWGEYDTNLRPFVKTILNQGSVGSCAAEACAQALMTTRAVAGQPHVVYNPWSLYYKTSGGRDSGSSIDENLELAMEQGICPEEVWPRSKGWNSTPNAVALQEAKKHRIVEVFDIATIDEFVSALLLGFAVEYGANGHALCAVQHTSNGPLVANSWSTSWKDGGFGIWVPYNGVNWQYGCWAARVGT